MSTKQATELRRAAERQRARRAREREEARRAREREERAEEEARRREARERALRERAEAEAARALEEVLRSSSSPNYNLSATLDEIVTSSLSCTEVVLLLTNHGCHDLTKYLDESSCSRFPVANGGLGDVFSGRLINGTPIAIKTIRTYYDQGQAVRMYHKRAAKEIYTWSKCKHPNVVQLIGLAVFRDCLAMISRWEENGSLLQYLSQHPSADRCYLSTSICAGLAYLHDHDIVHGDLKGANVLISQDGTPMLMDFGNASLQDASLQFTQTNTGPNLSLRWTAPEIIDGGSHTVAGDIYSLGMTILETFTSEIPFMDRTERSLVMHVVVMKKTPVRPENAIPTRSIDGDKLWAILTKCWSYAPEDRPSTKAVLNDMKQIEPENLKEVEAEVEGEDEGELEGGRMEVEENENEEHGD